MASKIKVSLEIDNNNLMTKRVVGNSISVSEKKRIQPRLAIGGLGLASYKTIADLNTSMRSYKLTMLKG